MAMSHVELYEALLGPIGPEAARLIANIVPPAKEIATRLDVAGVREEVSKVRTEIATLRGETRAEFSAACGQMREGFASIRADIADDRAQVHALNSRTIRWILAFSIPMWAGTWGTMVAVLLRGA